MTDDLWLRFYIFIRSRENNLDLSQELFENLIRNSNDFKHSLDWKKALDYADFHMRLAPISKRKERGFRFTRD